jgi:hypothetical protein
MRTILPIWLRAAVSANAECYRFGATNAIIGSRTLTA